MSSAMFQKNENRLMGGIGILAASFLSDISLVGKRKARPFDRASFYSIRVRNPAAMRSSTWASGEQVRMTLPSHMASRLVEPRIHSSSVGSGINFVCQRISASCRRLSASDFPEPERLPACWLVVTPVQVLPAFAAGEQPPVHGPPTALQHRRHRWRVLPECGE